MPIKQYLYFDAIECLPESIVENSNTDSIILPDLPSEKSRYYSQEIVFGKAFQRRLGQAKYFIVRLLFLLQYED